MLPENTDILKNLDGMYDQPSTTYRLDFENKRIHGYITNQEALNQAVKLMTLIERNKYGIYDSDYGIETNDLIGKPTGFTKAILESRIKDACSIDERILDMYDFEITNEYDTIYVRFKLKSIYEEELEQELIFKGIIV